MGIDEILNKASEHLFSLEGKTIPVLDITKPDNIEYAQYLAKVISKLSPLLGNMIEFYTCSELNTIKWDIEGKWIRQDPGFPDTIFDCSLESRPGIEIKTWFPLATEITARFKDSIKFFRENQTNVALVVWLPEFIIYGKPKIIGVWIDTAKSIAESRDLHYHNPPDYLVIEPEDTRQRTVNLQQTNVNGYKFQGNAKDFDKAKKMASSWGNEGRNYSYLDNYQLKLKRLLGKYSYRLDTNFAKIDRIQHQGLEDFKNSILSKIICNHSIKEWSKLFSGNTNDVIKLLDEILILSC
jgi:hypothetical protein